MGKSGLEAASKTSGQLFGQVSCPAKRLCIFDLISFGEKALGIPTQLGHGSEKRLERQPERAPKER